MYCKADTDQTFYYDDVLVILSVPTSRYRALSKTNYESNACLLLETDLRWLLWRLGLLLRALKSGLWPVMSNIVPLETSWYRQLRSCTLRDAVI